ncbi:siderophore-interacting protein [Leucobacter chinensis]|uniref:siderophore-interacting protein n=1 Tax=Leucobacter chinensis TaxID=2851010 RepID=UPI00350F6755
MSLIDVAVRELEVVRVSDVSPAMKRVTLAGKALRAEAFPPFVSTGFDDDVRMLFPYPGETLPVLPETDESGRVQFAPGRRPIARAYTVRKHDAEAGEIDLDVVLHGDDGVASQWAQAVLPGAPMHIVGPGQTKSLPESPDWWLMYGDDTALPAIARLLEELQPGSRGLAVISVAERAHRIELTHPDTITVHWVDRAEHVAEQGSLPEPSDLLRVAEWPEGEPFVWLAGEQSEVQALRRFVHQTQGVPKTAIDFTGYWKHHRHDTDAANER